MKQLYTFLVPALLLFTACTKETFNPDPELWMQTHERGVIAYVDYFTGNYIVDTYNGYAVVESSGGIVPREYDIVYANFSFRGGTTIYNRSGNYFAQGWVVDSWLTWSQALYLLDNMSYRP